MSEPNVEKPVHYVRGDDPSLVSHAVSRLTDELSGGDALAVERIAEDAELAAILDACQTPPFFAERRVVVAPEVGRFGAEDSKRLAEYVLDPNPTTALVLVSGGGTTLKVLLDAIKKTGAVVDADPPRQARARSQWFAEKVAASPVRLDPDAARLLEDHLGEDLGRLEAMLGTLAAAYGDGERISVDELDPFLGEAGGEAPWELTDAVDGGDTAEALVHLRRLLAGGERHPLVVLSTLHRHYEAILRLDGAGADDRAAAELLGGKSDFAARKALSQARRLGSAAIHRAIELLAQADLDLRGANEWPDELVLEVLVARLARLRGVPRRQEARRT